MTETTPETLPTDTPPSVTLRAFARLAKVNAGKTPQALRVAVAGGGCSGFSYDLGFDEPKPEDLVIEGAGDYAGQKVLIDPVSLPFLAGAVITYTDELIGARFVVENPNATSSCGCGVSFSM